MNNNRDLSVAGEVSRHLSSINAWRTTMSKTNPTEQWKGPVSRFMVDCNTLYQQIELTTPHSAADLIDFDDRISTLRNKFLGLLESVQ